MGGVGLGFLSRQGKGRKSITLFVNINYKLNKKSLKL